MSSELNEMQRRVLNARVNRARMSINELKPKVEEPPYVVEARKIIANFEADAKRIRNEAKQAKEDELTKVNMQLAFGTDPLVVQQAVDRYEGWCETYRKVNT